jgi:hypothetical protein
MTEENKMHQTTFSVSSALRDGLKKKLQAQFTLAIQDVFNKVIKSPK